MSFGFIILRHVNSPETDMYWQECHACIRKYYPTTQIVIIDDNSNRIFLTVKDLDNTIIVESEFPGRGELLPYYYYSRNKWFDTAVILHDSVFIQKHIDFVAGLDSYRHIWDFEHTWDNQIDDITSLLQLSNMKDLVQLYVNKDSWHGCFGCMSIITHTCIETIDAKYQLCNLLDFTTTREYRCAFERVIACMLRSSSVYPRRSLLGNIHKYCQWHGMTFAEYMANKETKPSGLPIVKIWTGR